jgi:hypothetical protein
MKGEDGHDHGPIRVEFVITDDDAVDASRAYAGYRSRMALYFGLALAVAGVLLWAFTRDLYYFVLTAVGLIAVAFGRFRALDRAYMRGQPTTRIGTKTEMVLEERGLHFRAGGVAGVVEWSAVTELRDGERSLLMLQGRTPLAYIPKRVFATEAQLDAARVWITRRIASRGG